jgi:hypothetical protein
MRQTAKGRPLYSSPVTPPFSVAAAACRNNSTHFCFGTLTAFYTWICEMWVIESWTFERGEQRGGPVALVVVRHSAPAPALEGQAGLGAVEGLDLALLVRAQDDGVFGRVQVQAQLVERSGIVPMPATGKQDLLPSCGERPRKSPPTLLTGVRA